MPSSSGAITVSTLATACSTPLPSNGSCRRRAVPRPHARPSMRPKAQWRGPSRRFPESRPLPRSDCRVSPELHARVPQQSLSYCSSKYGAAAGRSVGDGDPRQGLLRRRFESCPKARARAQKILAILRKKCVRIALSIRTDSSKPDRGLCVAAVTGSRASCGRDASKVTLLIRSAHGHMALVHLFAIAAMPRYAYVG